MVRLILRAMLRLGGSDGCSTGRALVSYLCRGRVRARLRLGGSDGFRMLQLLPLEARIPQAGAYTLFKGFHG